MRTPIRNEKGKTGIQGWLIVLLALGMVWMTKLDEAGAVTREASVGFSEQAETRVAVGSSAASIAGNAASTPEPGVINLLMLSLALLGLQRRRGRG